MDINNNNLFNQFADIKNLISINILKCYKVLFNKNSLLKNILSFLIIVITIFHLISSFIFYYKQYDEIKQKILDIITTKNKLKDEKEKENNQNIKQIKKPIEIKNNIKKNNQNSLFKKRHHGKNKKKRIINNNMFRTIINEILKNEKMKTNIAMKNETKIVIINPNIKNKEINNNYSISIMELNDIELNILPFDLALKKDKRTYLTYYISLLLTKHNFLSIFNNNDYNSKIIKIDLIFLSLSINFTVNALFFNDNTIHKIYEDKGVFNFIYQLPQIIYSSLISTVLNICLKTLGLSSDTIIKFKQEKNDKTTNKKTDLYYKLKIQFILFFTLGFIFLIFFWFYL